MQSRVFSLQDQEAFARLSGDWNPIHVDPVYARRCLGGQVTVHGIHAVMWALDSWLAKFGESVSICALKASYLRPIPLDSLVTCAVTRESAGHAAMEISCANSLATSVEVEWSTGGHHSTAIVQLGSPERRQPSELSVDTIEKAAGKLELYFDGEPASKLFPYLVKLLSPSDIAIFLGTSRLVGVECPGLHSLSSELHLVSANAAPASGLSYEVTRVDRRFNLINIRITAPGLAGNIKAFARPEPQRQADWHDIQVQVKRGEFAAQRALIVGGSRGLGELVAKVLAAGGADVMITYHQGREDAARVVEEIVSSGGQASYLQFDVLDQPEAPTVLESWHPSHLYYFATPFIFSGRRGRFSADLFEKFCRYYVTGFANAMKMLNSSEARHAFYPSTVELDELPLDMAEYTAAKAAGETLCALLEKSRPGTTIFRPRLPRLATDQTASLLPVDNQAPLPIMIELLRSFRDQSRITSAANDSTSL